MSREVEKAICGLEQVQAKMITKRLRLEELSAALTKQTILTLCVYVHWIFVQFETSLVGGCFLKRKGKKQVKTEMNRKVGQEPETESEKPEEVEVGNESPLASMLKATNCQ